MKIRIDILAALILLATTASAQENWTLGPFPAVPDVASADVIIDALRLVQVCDALQMRDASTPGAQFRTVAITSSTASNDRILAPAHGLVTGQTIVIASHSGSTPSINGARTVTVVDANNFTIGVDITVSGTGGSFTVDCTLGNACLAKSAVGGASCTMTQARAVGLPIYPHTPAGHQGWADEVLRPGLQADLDRHRRDAVRALRARKIDSDSQASKDADCSAMGTVANCQ